MINENITPVDRHTYVIDDAEQLITHLKNKKLCQRIVFDSNEGLYLVSSNDQLPHPFIVEQVYNDGFYGEIDIIQYIENGSHRIKGTNIHKPNYLYYLLYTPDETIYKNFFDGIDHAYSFKNFGTIYTKGFDLQDEIKNKLQLQDIKEDYATNETDLNNMDFGFDINELDFDLLQIDDLEEPIQDEIEYDSTEHYVVLDKDVITDKFKQWWGNSYCCNREGNPIIVYHSTNAEFDVFSKDFDGTANGRPVYGGGFCFSAYESYTKDFGSKVMPCVLSIQKPLNLQHNPVLDLKTTYKLQYKDDWQKYYNDENHTSRGYLQDKCSDPVSCFQMLTAGGYTFEQIMDAYNYDGIIDGHVFVVVRPNQIKSIYNKGNWSRTNDNIFECKGEYKRMNIPQLVEKLKQMIIEPQEQFLDEMEDESGMNKVEECVTATPSIGPAPTPALGQTTINGNAVEGKSVKKKKSKQPEQYTKMIDEINSFYEELNTSIDDVIIAWLDKLNFKNLKSDVGFIYKNSNGNFLHYIIFNKPNKIKYIIKNIDNQTLFSDEWQVTDPQDTETLFRNTIGPKFDSFE